MKKLVSLIALLAMLCTLMTQPVAFAADTIDAYAEQDVSAITPKSVADVSTQSYRDGGTTKEDGEFAYFYFSSAGLIHLRNVEFGNVAPASAIIKLAIDNCSASDYVRIYAVPAGTQNVAIASRKLSSITLPGEETAITDETELASYLIAEHYNYFNTGYHYHKEIGADGDVNYEFKLNGAKASELVDVSKDSNVWDIIVCGHISFTDFRFASVSDAYSYQNVFNNGIYDINQFNNGSGTEGYTLAVNKTNSQGGGNATIEFKNMDFGNTQNRKLAAMVNYYKRGSGAYNAGDILFQIKNTAGEWEEYGRLTTVATMSGSGSAPTTHYVMLKDNITGVHDVRLVIESGYCARVYMMKFADLGETAEEAYGTVTYAVDETDPTKTNVVLPINKNYIKGASKFIVALYDVNPDGSKSLALSQNADVNVETVFSNATSRTDYGFDSTLAKIQFNTADIAGREIKAFLWKDMTDFVPLVPATSVTAE